MKEEDMRIIELTEKMKANLFRADYKYAERSGRFKKWSIKEHKYHNLDYIKNLNVGDKGYVIREFSGEPRFCIYKCKISKIKNNTVRYKVKNMKYVDNDLILIQYDREQKLKRII